MNSIDSEPGGPRDVYELLSRQAQRAPDAEAIRFLPKGDLSEAPATVTRGELVSRIARTANLFRGLGVGPGDVVSIMAPNLLEVQYAFWAAEQAGAVNPINFLLTVDHVGEILRATRAKVLVTVSPSSSPEIWAKALAAAGRTPHLATIITLGPGVADGARAFDALLAETGDRALEPGLRRRPSDIAAYFHTGGTTGAPKLVAHTHGNQIHAAQATAASYGFTPADTVMCGLPMFHVAAPILVSLAPLSTGARVLMPTAAGNRDPQVIRNYWRIVTDEDVTLLGGVPTTLADILAHGGAPPADLADGRICMTGGAQLAIGLQARFEQATGIPIHQIYGMTETAGVICAAPRSERPPAGSVGRPVTGVEVEVRRLASDGGVGPACGPGEVGAIRARGPNITPGYTGGEASLSPACDPDGWLPTGDLGYLDADGWLFVTGRSKDVIIRSGHNIDPAAIEEVARTHPAILDAAAVGRPDPRAGEAPVLFVVLRPGTEVCPDALRDFMARHISEAPAKPVEVFVLPALPLTAVGKLFRPALKAEALRRLVDERAAATFADGKPPEIRVEATGPRGVRLVVGGAPDRLEGPWESFADWLSQHAIDYELTS